MAATCLTTPKTNDRLARLWEELGANPVPLQPLAQPGGRAEAPVLLREAERSPGIAIDGPRLRNRNWRMDLTELIQNLLEPAVVESPPASGVETISEGQAAPEGSAAAAHEAALALYNPFHWEPKPAWVSSPARPQHPNTVDVQRFAARPKIPRCPLHKRPFYKRFFFYLQRWLNKAA